MSGTEDAEMARNFLSDLFVHFKYNMFAPGTTLINFGFNIL
jgi:hypothetical protein